MTRQPIHYRNTRRGFTLIEVLVVVGLILLLMSLTLVGLRNAIGLARESATKATILKIHGLVQQRADAFNRAMERTNLSRAKDALKVKMGVANKADSAHERAYETFIKKDIFRSRFPQSFSEFDLLTYPPTGVTITPAMAAKHQPVTESTALLYWLLTQSEVFGIAPVDDSVFSSSEVRDTDNDGLLEFVDGWGRPLRYYRWPTRLFRCGEDINGNVSLDSGEDQPSPLTNQINGVLDSSGSASPIIRTNNGSPTYASLIWSGLPPQPTIAGELDPLLRDPDDPSGAILRMARYLNPSSPETILALAETGNPGFGTPDTYHAFLIVSAGPDGDLGLYEPHVRTFFATDPQGWLCQPSRLGSLDDHPLADNISNRKR